jgi:hypothetical protein
MTWLGKILTFVVMVMAVVTMFFTAQAFVTRTAWQARADDATAKLKQSEDLRRQEERRHQAEVDALRRQAGLYLTQLEGPDGKGGLKDQNRTLAGAVEAVRAETEKLQKNYAAVDVAAVQQGTNLTATVAELRANRDQVAELQDKAVGLQLATELARREATKATNAARQSQAVADDYAKRVDDLQARVAELRARLGAGGGGGALGALDKPPPPLLENARGEVTEVVGDLLVVSIGIDSGLAVNTTLQVSRADGTYLGTAKVADAQGLFPKQAIVVFTPARKDVPLDRQPPAALPRKGDLVRPAAPGR